MEIAFETKKLRLLCENEQKALAALGPFISEQLKHRLADLDAATRITDVVVGNLRPVSSDNNSVCTIELGDGCQMHFKANHRNNPRLVSGAVDWNKVNRIMILEIGGKK